MSKTFKPGEVTGGQAGIYQERGPRGGQRDNFTTIPEHTRAPPTSSPGASWERVRTTPHGTKR